MFINAMWINSSKFLHSLPVSFRLVYATGPPIYLSIQEPCLLIIFVHVSQPYQKQHVINTILLTTDVSKQTNKVKIVQLSTYRNTMQGQLCYHQNSIIIAKVLDNTLAFDSAGTSRRIYIIFHESTCVARSHIEAVAVILQLQTLLMEVSDQLQPMSPIRVSTTDGHILEWGLSPYIYITTSQEDITQFSTRTRRKWLFTNGLIWN